MMAIHGHTRALYVYTKLPSGVGKPAMHDPPVRAPPRPHACAVAPVPAR